MSNTILINDVSINGQTNTPESLSTTLQNNTVNAIGVDASSRTIWVNGQPYGNAYVNVINDTVEAPIGAEIFNDFANNVASGQYSHAEGNGTTANGEGSHAEGAGTTAKGSNSHAEGNHTTAYGDNSHAEGWALTAAPTIEAADIENGFTGLIAKWNADEFSLAYGKGSHVEGQDNLALGDNSHAEGGWTKAYGAGSHVEGGSTISIGRCSHAEGYDTTAQGSYSHTEGEGTITTLGNDAEHAQGRYNVSNTNTIHSVGIGTSINDRKNAYEILKTGKHYIYNLGGYDGTNPSDSKDIATILSTVDTSDTNGFTVENTLTVGGATTLSSTLGVTGATSLSSLSTSGNTTVGGTLGVTGTSTFSGDITATGKDITCGAIKATTNSYIGGCLNIGSTTTQDDYKLKVNGTLHTTSNTTIGGTLTVTGATLLNGNVTLGNAIGDVITVSGTTSFNSSISVFGSGTFDSSITAVTSFVLSKKDGSNYTQFINANANSNSFSVGFDSTSKLNFNGESTFTNGPVTIGSTTGNQNLTIYGNALATAFYERSDATKKDVVSNLDVDFDKLKQIPKVNFTWKNDTEKQNNIGTIAQDLNKVYPELVNGEEGNMTVDYAKLSIIALAAIDKLEDRIKQLEDKLSVYEK